MSAGKRFGSAAVATTGARTSALGLRAAIARGHRYAGLATALFLFVAGLSGAVISCDHELDKWLNLHLYEARSTGAYRAPLDLAARIEAADARVRVTFVPLRVEDGRAAVFGVQPKGDPATGRLFEPGYNQVFVDPVTGETIGRREWEKVALNREHLLSFLYKLHYSLHIPESAASTGCASIIQATITAAAAWG